MITLSELRMTETYENSPIDRIFGVVLEKQTYKNMGYLLLSFPLGLFYFVILVPGISLSVSLMFIVAGFPLLLGVLLLSDQLLRFERYLLRTVLNQPMFLERRRFAHEQRIFARLGERLAQGYTWKGLLYLLLRFAMGLVSFTLVVVLTPLSVLLISLPLTYKWIPVHLFDRTVTNFDEALICCSMGAILALVSTHLFNAWTALWKRIAAVLLS
jgi:hypothetical protein